ncbi:hypothetical protein O181_048212 [Austropuccinia psidii MF-1]|uniref:Uncharacterized protein n=1 Tax=Austropuccinia psidii MF-1 TaxID=1389203 RepID=A0A9Q3HLE6_9BASI|nr:hypothetical protein [Austropuccinia psidii MF-1]
MAIGPIGPNFGHGPYFQPWPLETTRGHQTSSASIPLNLRGVLPFLRAPRTQGCRSGAYMVLYTIMHHFCSAIQWRRLQDQIQQLKIKVSKSNAHFEGGFFNSSVWQSMAAIRRPFKDPNHLPLQELGWQFHSGLFQGHSRRVYSLSISFQGIKYLNTPWTTQLVHTGVNQATCMSFSQFGQFNLPPWEFNYTVQLQYGQNCIGPIKTIQPVIHLPESVFQFFAYTGHLSAPGDFFPS